MMFRLIKNYVKQYKKYAFLTMFLVMFEVAAEVMMPYVMSLLIKYGIGEVNDQGIVTSEGDIKLLLLYGGGMLLLAILSMIAGTLAARTAVTASQGFAKNLRQAEFHKIQDYSFANIDKFSTASLVTRLTTDVTNTASAFQMTIRMMMRAPMMLIFAIIMIALTNPTLLWVYLVAVPVLVIGLTVIMLSSYPSFRTMLKKYDAMNASVQENLIAIRAVKAFVRKDYEDAKFLVSSSDVRKAQVKAERIMNCGMPMMQFVMYSCMIAVVYICSSQMIQMPGKFQPADLTAYISYVMMILMSLMMISMFLVNLVLSRASMKRITEVLEEIPDISDEHANPTLEVENGDIEFQNVSFSYAKDPNNLTLEEVNLKIPSGSTVGIIGGTGSSKTTFVQLIPRLYDVLTGSIKVGGHDVRDYKLDILRNAVAMVLQKNVLFSGSIKENLKWGNEDATMEEIVEACKQAQADEFIQNLPGKYDMDLGQGGVNVSGGQKQRLCIARALLKKPKVLILDDSTSAVDMATDAKIRHSFKTMMPDVTKIIIAQRIASVEDADIILVFNEGKIVDMGNHEQLIQKSMIYKEVYESQKKGVSE